MEKGDRPIWRDGFLHCRLVGVDESSGEAVQVSGVHARLRAAEIRMYHQDGPGVVVVWLRDEEDEICIVGDVADVDRAMRREHSRLFSVEQKSDDE